MITAGDLKNQLVDNATATIILFSGISSVKLGETIFTSPLDPLSSLYYRARRSIGRLERGEQERGGFAPSQIYSPSQTRKKVS
jgi:hypothetical protein